MGLWGLWGQRGVEAEGTEGYGVKEADWAEGVAEVDMSKASNG